jgi:hypothetical protein
MRRPMYRTHFCWADDTHPNPLLRYAARSVNTSTRPSMWLAPKNPHLHKCQRCGYFVWRLGNGEQTP